jgi:hypothetical protein
MVQKQITGIREHNLWEEYVNNQLAAPFASYLDSLLDLTAEGTYSPSQGYVAYIKNGYGINLYDMELMDGHVNVPVIGAEMHGNDTLSSYATLDNRLRDDTLERKMHYNSTRMPNSGISETGALYQRQTGLDDTRLNLPEASRNLAQLVSELGVPSPQNPSFLSIVSREKDGTFASAMRMMPDPEPALKAEAEKHARENMLLNVVKYETGMVDESKDRDYSAGLLSKN